ncbi:hypothetical protein PoB_000903200 [Plakobranchus ocellatus]|uniref:Uncharacterized protein n=1 Tax=Plakobranchus ocellatus TaxID=259542 RepID=A0AAV3YJH1_9GAST|nr:hypothetical protein PoB_000903200 [Plakobranchus ocellatus]
MWTVAPHRTVRKSARVVTVRSSVNGELNASTIDRHRAVQRRGGRAASASIPATAAAAAAAAAEAAAAATANNVPNRQGYWASVFCHEFLCFNVLKALILVSPGIHLVALGQLSRFWKLV